MMFIAALKLHYKDRHHHKSFQIPGGTVGKWLLCVLGLSSCLLTLCVGFIPPQALTFGNVSYAWIFAAGMVILGLPGVLLACRK